MGCPLRCDWCHNPESQNFGTSYLFDRERCAQCGACGGRRDYDCLRDARRSVGYDMDVDELLDKLEKDRLFYEETGGGVTFSGGEPLAQPESLKTLLEGCASRDIPACLDTSGFWKSDRPLAEREISDLAALCERILFDIKSLDPVIHKRHTGGDLERVLDTLDLFLRSETPVELRVPLIPGVNSEEECQTERERFFASLSEKYPGKPDKVTYLDYHETGRHKYTQLGKPYPMDQLVKEKS